MRRRQVFRTIGVVAVALSGIVAMVAGQGGSSTSPAAKVPLDELLAEVRQLRSEINQAASASIRAQLVVARLQVQEQRVAAVTGQLLDVQNRLRAVQQGEASMRDRLAATEAGQARLPPEDRSEAEIQALSRQLEQEQNREQELRTQESTLSNAAAAEQSRWAALNDRLDALERSLPAAASSR